MRSPRRLLALAGLLLAVAVAGCGDDAEAKNAYVQRVAGAQQVYLDRFEQVRRRLTATSTLAQDRSTLRAFGTATATFVKALGQARPPEAVADEHAALVKAVQGYQREVEGAAAKLEGGTAEQRAQVRTDLSSGIGDSQRAITDAVGRINTGLRD